MELSWLTLFGHSTEEKIASVHCASAEDVDRAVLAAHKALKHPSWKRLPATERGMLMMKLADLIEQNKELLATIDAWDNGKCYITDVDTTASPANPIPLHRQNLL
jgi:aldehyde dehydrogenase (NAD+)